MGRALRLIAGQMSAPGSNNTEQARSLAEDGWSRGDVQRWLWERTTRSVRDCLDDLDPYSAEVAGRRGMPGG